MTFIPNATSATLQRLQERTFTDEVEIRNPSNLTIGSKGSPSSGAYSTVETVPARVRLQKPADHPMADRREQDQEAMVRMIARSDVTEDTRLLWTQENGETLVLSVIGIEYTGVQEKQMSIVCSVDRLEGDHNA